MIASRKRLRPWPALARARSPLAVVALLCALCSAAPAGAEAVRALLIMPGPDVALEGDGLARYTRRLEALVGTKLTPTGTTRTGALQFALDTAVESRTAFPRLQRDRGVLWVDVPAPSVRPKARAKSSTPRLGQKLMVRLKAGVAADWQALGARFGATLGVSIAPERQIGDVWVLRLFQRMPEERLVDFAEALQGDPAVQYADPVLRRFAQSQTPNDPYYGQQWSLTESLTGISLASAWAAQTATGASVTVAVVDTGVLPHPDLDAKVLPGYDFISDAEFSRDGDGRDGNPRDEGDWDDGLCNWWPSPSSWHGTFVSGLIAAISNNGIGIVGVDPSAKILPVRVLGLCGGTDEDIFAGVRWAAGADVAGAPANPNPAKVINMSLGGPGGCTHSIQDAINDAMAHGAVVVVAAGNDSDDATAYAPANCSGVITVGAHNRLGELTVYSNFGRRIDISAPVGNGDDDWDSTISLSNDGPTAPASASYKTGVGTSFAAPLVAGTASLMLSRNATLTAGQVLAIVQGTARNFIQSSPCRLGNLCGLGMLDAGLALASTTPSAQAAPAGTVPVIEYYNERLDHYFMTIDAFEIAALDASGGLFRRTGNVFFAYPDAGSAPADAKPVCRFYAGPAQQIDSHFFSAEPGECQAVAQYWPGVWQFESSAAFYVQVPDASGRCAEGTLPVYRFFDNRRDANHRYTIDLSVRRSMINKAWVPEGSGSNGAAFCSPI